MPKVIEESRFKGQDEWMLENAWDVEDYADSLTVLARELAENADPEMANRVGTAWLKLEHGEKLPIEYQDGELTWRYRWVEDEPVIAKPASVAPRMALVLNWTDGDVPGPGTYDVVVTDVGEVDGVITVQVTGPMDQLVDWVDDELCENDSELVIEMVKKITPVF